ncbi:DNA polymerase [Janibacter melonis]|uniref:DNA polymerase n=1 Tax=Janibacter melonis TaxID=262209 RepID=UPI001F078006|nr:DNA polymerase [Janibacter melonis]
MSTRPLPGTERALVLAPGVALAVGADDHVVLGPDVADGLAALGPTRWVTWSARDLVPLLATGAALPRTWDVAETHRLLHGGWRADPATAWAHARGLDPGALPAPVGDDLFAALSEDGDPDDLVRPDGYLRADAGAVWASESLARGLAWGRAALEVARWQQERLERLGPRAVVTAHAESAAAVLAVELERDGLPVDRATLEELVMRAAGPRPVTEADEARARAERDAPVLASVPGIGRVDLRNPAAVRSLLATAGVDVPSTRKSVLAEHVHRHPVVPALLEWRRRERIATTYGWRWLAEHVGADDRLRGAWTACDGAAGRMTAQAGLHNLPAELRPGVAAAAGHVLVRADLGQVEPRVLAVVSGDKAFAAASTAADLYEPVAQRLGVERPVAKIAVLAAMYGQRSGAAGEALRGLERAYPVAMGHLDRAQREGEGGRPVRTFGGRLVRTAFGAVGPGEDPGPLIRSRGRFARNAVIQGSAAELFKAWAVTVREAVRPLGGQVVLCLHDELLVHVPQEHGEEVARLVDESLRLSARRWCGHDRVRFVSDTSVVRRWSEAK